MKMILGTSEISEAVECYLAKQGLNTGAFDLDVKIIVSRSEDSKIEVDMTKKELTQKQIDLQSEVDVTVNTELPFGSPE